MKSYYNILDIERNADAPEIKRAYFKLVKKYPPERFPEEFKELRAAYEVLSDEKKRADYDKEMDKNEEMPEEAVLLYHRYKTLMEMDLFTQAREVIEELLERFPDIPNLRAELARSLAAEGKSGKASDVWEELCKLYPDNTEYILGLAEAYNQRGWRKKAITEYSRVIDLDSGNAKAWESLVKCHILGYELREAYRICLLGIDALKKKGKESIRLYMHATISSINRTHDCDDYFDSIARLLAVNPEIMKHEGEDIVAILLNNVMVRKRLNLLPSIQKMAELLPEVSENLRDELETAQFFHDIDEFSNKGYSDVFHDLFVTLHEDKDDYDNSDDEDDVEDEEDKEAHQRIILLMELEVLKNISTYRSELLRIQIEFPQFYALHADFFNEALRTHEKDKLIHQRVKLLYNKEYSPSFAVTEQFRRDQPKVGRNDPCPCGSGKKYKKCCGASGG